MKKLTLSALFVFALVLTGCTTGSKKGLEESAVAGAEGLQLEVNADSDSGKAGPLKTVYFDYDSANLTEAARMDLDSNISYIKQIPGLEVQIEGHCDERGGVQYNLALGERRAKAIRSYMATAGIDKKRVTTISFGKERPLSPGHDDESWGKNRRGNFVVTAIGVK